MKKKVVCFGEALWDNFPDYKEIGGAPLNVAYHLNKLGVDTQFITKVGGDEMGKQIIKFIDFNILEKILTFLIFSEAYRLYSLIKSSL